MKKSKAGKSLFLLCASTVLALLISEAAARIVLQGDGFFPLVIRHVDRDVAFEGYVPDPELFWRIRPGAEYRLEIKGRPTTTGTANKYGLRGPDFDLKKPSGEKRILFLGDSATFGLYVKDQEAYPFVAEEILNEAGRGSVRAINGGVTGYSSHQALKCLQDRGKDFAPDVVCMCLGHNDASLRFATDLETRDMIAGEHQLALVRLFKLAVLKYKYTNPGSHKSSLVFRVPPGRFRENMLKICAIAKEMGAEAVIIAGPGRFPGKAGDASPQEYYANEIAEAVAKEAGAVFVPLRGLRAVRPDFNHEYFEDSYHPNAQGHRAMAEIIAKAIAGKWEELRGGGGSTENQAADSK